MDNKPLIYYPFQPDFVSQSIHHQLRTDLPPYLHTDISGIAKKMRHVPTYQEINRIFFMGTAYTTDDQKVLYADLYSGTKALSSKLTLEKEKGSLVCHILSLYNPIKPHLKSINCYQQILKSFICEKLIPGKNPIITLNVEIQNERYGLMKCSSGQYISTLYTCDGNQDCSDGTDELNCYCFERGKMINDSIYCSKTCSLKMNCTCSILFTNHESDGCHSFVDPKQTQNKNISINTQSMYSCMHSNLQITNSLINDLIFDCPNEDDEPELLNESAKYLQCAEQNMHECYPGHSRCYTKHQKCIYNLTSDTQMLMYCRNGQHLQDCETKSCLWMFKCPDSYCIPYRYMCDGKWDCWHGEDEINCRNYSCIKMFKCKLSSSCIHTNNVCDGTIDCPSEDDEMICIEPNCIDQCTCLNYGIDCQHGNLNNLQSVSSMLNYFLYIRITYTAVPQTDVNMLTNAIILISTHNGLLQPFPCHSALGSIKIKVLDMSFNKINKLHKQHFKCLSHLIQMVLDHNEITRVVETLFEDLTKLKVLSLNSNKIASLFKCSFCSLNNLVLLNLLNNSILFVDSTIFGDAKIHLILTDDFPVCCMFSNIGSVCTSKPVWPSSCLALLSNIGLKLACWLIGIILSLCNILSIFGKAASWYNKIKFKNYDKYVIAINISDLMVGLYLISIASADVIVGDNYVELDLSWRTSLPCHALSFMSMCAILISTFFMLGLSIERYRVIKYPLSRRGSMKTEAVFPVTCAILTSIVLYIRHQVEGVSYLSSPLCILLGKSGNSATQNILTVAFSFYLLLTLFIVLILHYKLIILSNQSEKILHDVKQRKRQKSVTTNVVLVGLTNVICWIPSSIFYIVSVFNINSPVALLYWITLVILPINAMINPIIFNFSEIRSKMCVQK